MKQFNIRSFNEKIDMTANPDQVINSYKTAALPTDKKLIKGVLIDVKFTNDSGASFVERNEAFNVNIKDVNGTICNAAPLSAFKHQDQYPADARFYPILNRPTSGNRMEFVLKATSFAEGLANYEAHVNYYILFDDK